MLLQISAHDARTPPSQSSHIGPHTYVCLNACKLRHTLTRPLPILPCPPPPLPAACIAYVRATSATSVNMLRTRGSPLPLRCFACPGSVVAQRLREPSMNTTMSNVNLMDVSSLACAPITAAMRDKRAHMLRTYSDLKTPAALTPSSSVDSPTPPTRPLCRPVTSAAHITPLPTLASQHPHRCTAFRCARPSHLPSCTLAPRVRGVPPFLAANRTAAARPEGVPALCQLVQATPSSRKQIAHRTYIPLQHDGTYPWRSGAWSVGEGQHNVLRRVARRIADRRR